MPRHVSGRKHIEENYNSRDRILLVNPPVYETRYQWIKWNQPLDLLKLSTFLKANIGCEVKLFDFMLPRHGKVPKRRLKNTPSIEVNGTTYSLHHFGRPFSEFKTFADVSLNTWKPTAIWITSLTSYWWQSVRDTILNVQNSVQDVEVVLFGNYPRLEPEHALNKIYADLLVTDLDIKLSQYKADTSLYDRDCLPDFCGLDINSRTDDIGKEISDHVSAAIHHFVFFNDDILKDPDHLEEVLREIGKVADQVPDQKFKPKFHGICGIYPGKLNAKLAKLMASSRFREIHFEYAADASRVLDLESYFRASEAVRNAGFRLHRGELSGFVNIGLPDDTPHLLMQHVLNLLEIFGFVIPKPFSPTPGSDLYLRHKDVLDTKNIELLSPHFFPFSRINGISSNDYDELYRLTAFMNYPVRQQSFDLFPGTIGYEMFRNSLERKVWQNA